MPLNINAEWHAPVTLLRSTGNLVYECPQISELPADPGIYMFARKHGRVIQPCYIGQSRNIQRRLRQHIVSSVELMNAMLNDYPRGERLFIYATLTVSRRKDQDAALRTLERMMINHVLSMGFAIINKKGTKPPTDSADVKSPRSLPKTLFPSRMLSPQSHRQKNKGGIRTMDENNG